MDQEEFDKYYMDPRPDFVRLFPPGVDRVLDVGCGGGAIGHLLKQKGVELVVGVELDPRAAEEARKKLDIVIEADIEGTELPFESGYFDCIILGDILEHLVDPWQTLKHLRYYLATGGAVVCSLPNVRYYKVVQGLLSGRWEYADEGVLDRTHLRFFTLRSMKEMIEGAGLTIIRIEQRIVTGPKAELVHKLTFRRLADFFTKQYLILARNLPSERDI